MNISTSEIVDQVFDEYTSKIVELSAQQKETISQLQQMHQRIIDLLYKQYYNNTSRFMSSIDLDDVLSSSPPRNQMIQKKDPVTPHK